MRLLAVLIVIVLIGLAGGFALAIPRVSGHSDGLYPASDAGVSPAAGSVGVGTIDSSAAREQLEQQSSERFQEASAHLKWPAPTDSSADNIRFERLAAEDTRGP